jgi:hypothetical protein
LRHSVGKAEIFLPKDAGWTERQFRFYQFLGYGFGDIIGGIAKILAK